MNHLWRRFRFDPADVAGVRSRLITMLSRFVQGLAARGICQKLAGLEKRYEDQEQNEILDWISMDYAAHELRFKSLISSRESSTRKWLLNSDEWLQ